MLHLICLLNLLNVQRHKHGVDHHDRFCTGIYIISYNIFSQCEFVAHLTRHSSTLNIGLSSFDAKLAIKSLPRLLSKIVIASILKQFETFIQFLPSFLLFFTLNSFYFVACISMKKRRLLKYYTNLLVVDKSKRRNVVVIKNIITL